MPLSTRATYVLENVLSDPSTSVEVLAFFNNPASLGLVTSVGVSAPSEITVSGSPVTGASTIALTWTNESANVVFAGPATGSASTPSFRALVSNDIPTLAYSKITGLANDLASKAPIDSPTFTTAVTLADGVNIATSGGTGTKIGTTSSQKIGFWGTTGVTRPTGDILTALGTSSGMGLISSPTISEADVTNLVSDLALKAPLASPTFTGVPAAPTATGGTNTTQLATTAFVQGILASPAFTGTPTAPTATAGTNTTQLATTAFIQAFINMDARTRCGGRLTLTSGDPIENSGTGSTLYFTPFINDLIGLYDGSANWSVMTFAETSISVPVGTGVYDVFGYNNSGTFALETLAWSTATARATAIVRQNGVFVKSGATTRRYLGTIYSVSGTCTDSVLKRFVWNYANRIQKKVIRTEAGNPTTYTRTGTPSTTKYVNDNTANKVEVVCGVQESLINLGQNSIVVTPASTGNYGSTFIGYDFGGSSTIATDIAQQGGNVASQSFGTYGALVHLTDIGYHTYDWLDAVYASGNVTFNLYASNGSASGGLFGTYWC